MKKLINILVFILLIGSFSDLSSQTYTRIGENNTQYTADQSTNHIFFMVKDGTYDPITINVPGTGPSLKTPLPTLIMVGEQEMIFLQLGISKFLLLVKHLHQFQVTSIVLPILGFQ